MKRISADAVPDEHGRLLYKVEICTERDHLGAEPTDLPLAPGMATQVDLRIGERSILSYLTDRVLSVTRAAFRERCRLSRAGVTTPCVEYRAIHFPLTVAAGILA